MFYSDAILSKRGPLGRVWLAAHMERKLSKTQTLQTDIGESVDAIIGQEGEELVMALRLSGQLLLGVVRIYNRKAKYLLDDCNEAMLKLKMAFRAGPADMTNAQMAVDRNAITLQGDGLDLDLLLPDLNWELAFDAPRAAPSKGRAHVAREADITLASDDLALGFGPSDGIGSNDFHLDVGLDLDFGDGVAAGEPTLDDDSIEVGRDAAPSRALRDSIASGLLGRGNDMDVDFDLLSNRSRVSRDPSEQPFGADATLDFGDVPMDLGLDFGDAPGDAPPSREKTPGQTRSPTSPLSTPPRTPPPELPLGEEPAVAEGEGEGAATPKAKKQRKEKKQIVDTVTELAAGPGPKRSRLGTEPPTQDLSTILRPRAVVPASGAVARLLAIRADPLAHFLPTIPGAGGAPAQLCAAPPGLAPELTALFMRPARGLAAPKRGRGDPADGAASKRRRTGDTVLEDEPEEPEQGRRATSAAPSVRSDLLGRRSIGLEGDNTGLDLDIGLDQTGGLDSFQVDLPLPADDDLRLPSVGPERMSVPASERARSRSRLSTPGAAFEDDMRSADVDCPIAAFDVRQNTQSQAPTDVPEAPADGKGYSKNTVKALSMIRHELKPADDDEDEEKVMSFNIMANKASRRAASAFFFELLVLSTRDCVKVDQQTPFEDIEIRAKDKLWERQRHASAAPSSNDQ